ncbi:nitrilase-related carbon-nitrogen hydrolase [Jatrophihabitans sp.]|uniref:nitrilase-related carbon-nitrogen hydrolase n=1 Tax=Jatrophihabitans sp. TaxID=1932789 RepID=UPI0030C77814|nr:putative carbon-nitrogen hydrolase [Jatrophihabitans sp.]
MKIAGIQHDIVWQDAEATHALVAPMIAAAAAGGARLIVLTEMFATGFCIDPEPIAQDEGGASEQFLLQQAALHDAYLIASVAQRGADGQYRNNAIVAAPTGEVWRYAKIHPFTYTREHENYTAGDQFLTVDIDGVRTSVFVCYDLRFADEFWAVAADTDLYVVVANWPESRSEHWKLLLRARAIENQAYVVGVNRIGVADRLTYTGDSAVIDPLGRTLAEASRTATVISSVIDPETVTSTRDGLPFLADRR